MVRSRRPKLGDRLSSKGSHDSSLRSQKSVVRPFRLMRFTKKDRTKKLDVPVYKDHDIIQLDAEFANLLNNNILEQQNDDDVETDEEVLCSGIQQCHTDLRDLKLFIRNNRHFRAKTNVVDKWKRRGFAFSQDGRQNQCTINFSCRNIF